MTHAERRKLELHIKGMLNEVYEEADGLLDRIDDLEDALDEKDQEIEKLESRVLELEEAAEEVT